MYVSIDEAHYEVVRILIGHAANVNVTVMYIYHKLNKFYLHFKFMGVFSYFCCQKKKILLAIVTLLFGNAARVFFQFQS